MIASNDAWRYSLRCCVLACSSSSLLLSERAFPVIIEGMGCFSFQFLKARANAPFPSSFSLLCHFFRHVDVWPETTVHFGFHCLKGRGRVGKPLCHGVGLI